MVLKSRLIKAANQVWESLNKKKLEEEYFVATNSSFKGLAIISFVMHSVMAEVFCQVWRVGYYSIVRAKFFLSMEECKEWEVAASRDEDILNTLASLARLA
nr:hypothetical protein CFP56_46301 [Quercus suber]